MLAWGRPPPPGDVWRPGKAWCCICIIRLFGLTVARLRQRHASTGSSGTPRPADEAPLDGAARIAYWWHVLAGCKDGGSCEKCLHRRARRAAAAAACRHCQARLCHPACRELIHVIARSPAYVRTADNRFLFTFTKRCVFHLLLIKRSSAHPKRALSGYVGSCSWTKQGYMRLRPIELSR